MKIIRLKAVPNEERGGYSIKRLFTHAFKNRPDNVGFYQTSIPKGSLVKNHCHEYLDEVLYFVTKGKVKVGNEIYNFDPGDMIILSAGEPHEIIADESEVRLIAIKMPNMVDDKLVFK